MEHAGLGVGHVGGDRGQLQSRAMKREAASRPPFTPRETTPQVPSGRYFSGQRVVAGRPAGRDS